MDLIIVYYIIKIFLMYVSFANINNDNNSLPFFNEVMVKQMINIKYYFYSNNLINTSL